MKKLLYKLLLASFIGIIPLAVLAQVFPLDVTITTTNTSIKYVIKNTTNQPQSYKYSVGNKKVSADFFVSAVYTVAGGSTKSGSFSTTAAPNSKYDITVMVVDANKEIISEKKFEATTKAGSGNTGGGNGGSGNTGGGSGGSGNTGGGNGGSGNTGGGSGNSGPEPMGLEDPIGEGVTIDGIISKLLDIIVTVGTPLVAFFFILTGFKYVTAQGNEEKLKSAKSAAIGTVIGAICVLGAWTFAQAIKGSIDDLRSALDIIKFL